MSVDERLRAALRDDRDVPAVELDAAFAAVQSGARRRTWLRRAASGAAIAVLVTGGVLLADPWSGPPTSVGPAAPPPAPSEAPSVPVQPPAAPTDELRGVWRTDGPVSWPRMRAAVTAAGGEAHLAALRAKLPSTEMWLELRFEAGYVTLIGTDVAGARWVLDDRIGNVGEELVEVAYIAGDPNRAYDGGGRGATSYRYDLEGDVLRLELRRSSESMRGGVPGEVYQRALYTAAPFRWAG